jgi:hypothetical protein
MKIFKTMFNHKKQFISILMSMAVGLSVLVSPLTSASAGDSLLEAHYYIDRDPTDADPNGQRLIIADVIEDDNPSSGSPRIYGFVAGFALDLNLGCEVLENSATVYRIKYCPTNSVNRVSVAQVLRILRTKATEQVKNKRYDDPVKKDTKAYVSDTGSNFKDISKLSEAQQKSINWLANTKATSGCNQAGNKFCPDSVVTRGAFAELVFKLASGTEGYQDYTPNFTDIKKLSKQRIRAINFLKDSGIAFGCNSKGTKFCPNKPLTWGSLAQMSGQVQLEWESAWHNKDCDVCRPGYRQG